MRTIGKIIVDLLSQNHISSEEADLIITKISENNKPLNLEHEGTLTLDYWYQTTT